MEIIILIFIGLGIIGLFIENPIGGITILVLGAIGYGVLGMISSNWAIFGAIVGGLLGIASMNRE